MDIISGTFQVRKNHLECSPAIMSCQIAHILKHERLRPLGKQYLFNVEEECTLRLMAETLLVTND